MELLSSSTFTNSDIFWRPNVCQALHQGLEIQTRTLKLSLKSTLTGGQITCYGNTKERATSSACVDKGRLQREGSTFFFYRVLKTSRNLPRRKQDEQCPRYQESSFSLFHCLLGTKTLFHMARQQHRDSESRKISGSRPLTTQKVAESSG